MGLNVRLCDQKLFNLIYLKSISLNEVLHHYSVLMPTSHLLETVKPLSNVTESGAAWPSLNHTGRGDEW